MGVTGCSSGTFKTTRNKEKKDPFHFLIELKYQGFWKQVSFSEWHFRNCEDENLEKKYFILEEIIWQLFFLKYSTKNIMRHEVDSMDFSSLVDIRVTWANLFWMLTPRLWFWFSGVKWNLGGVSVFKTSASYFFFQADVLWAVFWETLPIN